MFVWFAGCYEQYFTILQVISIFQSIPLQEYAAKKSINENDRKSDGIWGPKIGGHFGPCPTERRPGSTERRPGSTAAGPGSRPTRFGGRGRRPRRRPPSQKEPGESDNGFRHAAPRTGAADLKASPLPPAPSAVTKAGLGVVSETLGAFGGPWGCLGELCGSLGKLWGFFGGPLVVFGSLWGASGVLWGSFGRVLGVFWAALGMSLGASGLHSGSLHCMKRLNQKKHLTVLIMPHL